MPFLIALAARWGVPAKFQRLVGWLLTILGGVVIVALAYGTWSLWLKRHTDTAITVHDSSINAAASAAQAKADRAAGFNDAARMANIAADQQALKDARDEAVRHDSNPWDAVSNKLR